MRFDLEPLIRVKQHTLRVISSVLAEDEEIQIAIPCGNLNFEPGTTPRSKDRDYLVITDRRLISIKGAWFDTRQGLISFPRSMIDGVEVVNYLLGCTVTITVQPMNGQSSKLVFANCGKPEGESVKKMFVEQDEGRRCTGCGRTLRDEFTFCPFCKTSAKSVCRHCGKSLEDGWINCPYCGK